MSDPMPPLPPNDPPVSPVPVSERPVPATDENSWALAIHLTALLSLLVGTFPLVNILGPLVVWLIKRADSPYLDEVGKRVLNFQISWTIYFAIAWLSVLALIGFLLVPIGAIAWLIITILGAIKESNREPFKFPLTIQFLK